MAGPRKGRAKPDESRKFIREEAEERSARLRKRIAEVQNPTTVHSAGSAHPSTP